MGDIIGLISVLASPELQLLLQSGFNADGMTVTQKEKRINKQKKYNSAGQNQKTQKFDSNRFNQSQLDENVGEIIHGHLKVQLKIYTI